VPTRFRSGSLSILCSVLLFACAHSPQSNETSSESRTDTSIKNSKGEEIAYLAKSLLGSPYKYGGTSPRGFDCSGLVYYTHGKLGIRTPRTSLQQYNNSKHIKLNELHAGDLVFFRLNKSKVSHVGIYIGKGRFVHAPKSGKRVSVNYLNDDYWKPRIVSAGRLH
jgi:cell wall-associated NlpC family hydrolase